MVAGQVFWLSAPPVEDSLPIRVVPDSGRALVPSLTVPDYSGGSAPDLHRVPGCLAVLALFIAFPELSVKPKRRRRRRREAKRLTIIAFSSQPLYNFFNGSSNLD